MKVRTQVSFGRKAYQNPDLNKVATTNNSCPSTNDYTTTKLSYIKQLESFLNTLNGRG